MSYLTVPGTWTIITASGSVTDLVLSAALNGDVDGGYEGYFDILAASGTPSLSIQPNSSASNQTGEATYNNASTVSVSALSTLYLGQAGTATASRLRGHFTFTSKSGSYREFQCTSHAGTGTGFASEQQTISTATWKDSSTVITSLGVHSSGASGIAATSWVAWRRLNAPF